MIVRAHNRVRIRRRPTERHSIGILFGPKNAFYKIGTGDLSGADPRWIPTFGTTSKGSRSPNRLVTNQAMPSIREFYNWDGFGTTLWISAFSILNSLLGDQPSMGVENTLDRIRASLPQRSFTGHLSTIRSLHPKESRSWQVRDRPDHLLEHRRPKTSRTGITFEQARVTQVSTS